MNEEYNIGDWIYIIRAQGGAYGANNEYAKIVENTLSNVSGCEHGLCVQVYPSKRIWRIGNIFEARRALEHEIREFLFMDDDYKEDTSYLINLLTKHGIT